MKFFQSSTFAGPPEHITDENLAVRIRCIATGVESVILNNGEIRQTAPGTVISFISPFGMSDSGFYQCASSRDTLPPDNLYTTETLSAYFFATCEFVMVYMLKHTCYNSYPHPDSNPKAHSSMCI